MEYHSVRERTKSHLSRHTLRLCPSQTTPFADQASSFDELYRAGFFDNLGLPRQFGVTTDGRGRWEIMSGLRITSRPQYTLTTSGELSGNST